jgi:hypothetical protein
MGGFDLLRAMGTASVRLKAGQERKLDIMV